MHPTRPYTMGEDLELETDLGWRFFCPRHGLPRQRAGNLFGDLGDIKTPPH